MAIKNSQQAFTQKQIKHADIYDPAEAAVIVSRLDKELFTAEGRIKLMPAADWLRYRPDDLRIWAWFNAVFALPTLELVTWLKREIGDRSALEIGSGNNDLGFHAGIRQTDSYVQQETPINAVYQMIRQPATHPRPDVEKLDAGQAIATYKPQVVIGAWITQLWRPGDELGSEFGVDELSLLDEPGLETYIHVGHRRIHNYKRSLLRKHREYTFPWLLGRTKDQSGNFLALWGKA